MTKRERDFFHAGIYHCKTSLNLSQTPDPTITRFIVDKAQETLFKLDEAERMVRHLEERLKRQEIPNDVNQQDNRKEVHA